MVLNELNNLIVGGETYLVTGATGFIGSSIIFALLEYNKTVIDRPCKIIMVARNYDKAIRKFGKFLDDDNLCLIICDNKDKLVISQKVDWIIATAAVTKKEKFSKYPADTLNDNVFGIYNCLELAKEKKIKGLLFISSVQVYGKIQVDTIGEETFGSLDCMKEEAIYPESKRIGETLVWAYSKQYLIPAKCVRLFHVYGEGEEHNNGTFLSDFLKDMIEDKDVVIKGDGSEIRNLCYIRDAVRGIFYVLQKGKIGEVYNVGSEYNNYSIKDIAEIVVRAGEKVGRKKKIIVQRMNYTNGKLTNKQIPDVRKIKGLGWKELYTNIEENFANIIKEEIFGYL